RLRRWTQAKTARLTHSRRAARQTSQRGRRSLFIAASIAPFSRVGTNGELSSIGPTPSALTGLRFLRKQPDLSDAGICRIWRHSGRPPPVIPGEGAKRRRPGTHPATSGLADEWVPALRGCAAAAGMTGRGRDDSDEGGYNNKRPARGSGPFATLAVAPIRFSRWPSRPWPARRSHFRL